MARMREIDTEGMLGGIGIPSAEELVVQFVQDNPSSDHSQIAAMIQRTGADLGTVADMLNVPRDVAQQAFDTAVSAQTPVQTAANAAQAEVVKAAEQAVAEELSGLDKVANFIAEGNKTDQQIYREMVKNDVNINDIATKINYPIDEATQRYTRAQELTEIEDIVALGAEGARREFPNGIPDNLIRRYALETADSPAQIAQNMDTFGVSVDDYSRATGIPLAQVQAMYAQGKGLVDTSAQAGTANVASGIASTTAVGGRAGSAGATGLSGAERALAGGLIGAAGTISAAEQQARQDFLQGAVLAQQALERGAQEATGAVGAGTQLGMGALGAGLGAARQDITGGLQAGLGALYQGLSGARADLQAAQEAAMQQYGAGLGDITAARDLAAQQVGQAFGQAGGMFDPYRQAGTQALQQQLALSGALGQEAFQQAFNESPQMQFLREQGERAALRTAAARGGVGGGNVMKELARYSTGLASQDLQQQIANLQALGAQGLGATGSAAQLAAQGGLSQADIQTQAAQQLAAQRGLMAQSQLGTGQQLAGLGTLAGQQGLSALTGAGQQLGQLGVTGGTLGLQTLTGAGSQLADILSGRALGQSQLASQAGQQLSDLGLQAALTNAAMQYGTGQDIGAYRMQAGRDIANNIAAQMAALSTLQGQQGAGMSDLIGQQAAILAGLQTGTGQGMANLIGGTAGQLSGIATGTGTAYDPAALAGTQWNQGLLSNIGNAMAGAGTGIGAVRTGNIPS